MSFIFINLLFFSSQKEIAKRGNCELISVLYSVKVRCDLLCQKNKPDLLHKKKILDARSHTIFSPTLVIGVLNEMKVKCKLNASNKLASPCVSKLSSSIQEITLYFLQQQVLLHVYMTW